MLKLYPLIFLCIFFKYPISILIENILENNEKLIELDAHNHKQYNRVLIEDNNEVFNIEHLKKLLHFQSKLDKQIRKQQNEEENSANLDKSENNLKFFGNGENVAANNETTKIFFNDITKNDDGKVSANNQLDNHNDDQISKINDEKLTETNQNISGDEKEDKSQSDQSLSNKKSDKIITPHDFSNNSSNSENNRHKNNSNENYPLTENNNKANNNEIYKKFELLKNHFQSNDNKTIAPKNEEEDKNMINDSMDNINYSLRKSDIKELIGINDIVKYIKNLLGIKSNIHEKFEHENLIIRDCNYDSFGPEFCSANEEAKQKLWKYENKKSFAFLFIILFTLFFGLLIQNVVYYIEKKVRNSKDKFRKDLLNTAFRQISLITIINLTIWGILQSKAAEALDDIIFNDILPKQRNVDEVLHNVEPLLEIIFEKILFISMNFLICYSLFILNVHFVTRSILKWFSEADNCDIKNIIKDMKDSRKGCFKNIFSFIKYTRNSKYLAHRYDFSENVDAISIPGLDPNGYYYYEYMRACLLKYNVKLIKIPNAVILFLVFACISLRPFFSIRLKEEVIFLNLLSLFCILGFVLLFIYLYKIDRKLLPGNISKYLLNKYHIDISDQNTKEIIPYYKLLKQQSLHPSSINYFIYKTTFPNKHEQLFFFWGNGPSIINFIFQALCFCFLVILSCWIFLLRVDNITCKTGYLIDTKLLERVWEFERSDNIKRISELIDAIKIKSTLHAVKEGGDLFWRQLLIKSSTVPSNIQEKMFSIWVGLDEENRGVINSDKILKFLKSQGINLTSENDIKEFLEVFDRNNKNGLNQEEFFVLIIIVKQILVELLDINAVQSLFEEVYGIPWNSLSSIDVNSLKRILSELNLHWPHGKIKNLIDFVCESKKKTYVSAEYFIKQLINIEEVTLQPFHNMSDTK
ncbi:conserved Plasmodium protein, unknown function [Plasmodium berghei]|uniref:EF-hand calcium-binding domain-containing protein, putative n=2 Tax=Plasmodium berghei TaxID=5821 RepID=A0A509AQ12_PLABA|nr:EF-hand calcium-binding domain-containing protein, putative [Plasmodium berghei ANKA]SCL97077.1 conserved Plasmodium protein, unknown function [Plasmodium berghei]SCM16549.1 conserved Plasmodium protein, unknown function [Plasmodium berghei]SCM18343.1 conserved Plasmodium protein, unknown function [Plasmodium berghei]SCN27772.1 conserved Plasmodium protein, unknown function [Plasmodium berghei]VUC57656.1 EF-hand calcium-binding domain-containing protein, putative [Plasmodium berghei ANKA]|eukprot:XP_034423426.1 EF-hand calcium-binding domain-containing protein, putative [Plasmodium berghei ANKA]